MKIEQIANGITMHCGDCRDILPTLPKADAVITDPPYGVGETYQSYNDTKENTIQLIKTFMPLAQQAANRVIVTPGNALSYHYPVPTWTMAWVTPAGTGRGPWGFSCWQPILCYGNDPFLEIGRGSRPDIFLHSEISEKETGHPCPKPLTFMKLLVERTALEGHSIIDPFTGSGTTGVAAVQQGCKFTGIELDKAYFDIACRRITNALKQPQLFTDMPEI